MAKSIGMCRALKLEWLNQTVELLLEGRSEQEIKETLTDYLSKDIKSYTNLHKTISILMNTWIRLPDNLMKLRNQVLKIYSTTDNKLALHWCMLLLTQPLFNDVCRLIGKISKIQDTFNTTWLKKQLSETWGANSTVLQGITRVLLTLKNFGVIENQKTGTYFIKKIPIKERDLLELVILSTLFLNQKYYYDFDELISIPQFFAFDYHLSYEVLLNSQLFKLSTFGDKLVKNNT